MNTNAHEINRHMVFSFDEDLSVRVQMQGDEPWFVAEDVCDALGIGFHRDALARLDGDERGSVIVDTLGGPQKVGAINEAGLYNLIFRSRKPEAKAFKRWVTHEVLPSIRKTGSYRVPLQGELFGVPAPVPRMTATQLRAHQLMLDALYAKKMVTHEEYRVEIRSRLKDFGMVLEATPLH